MPSNKKVTVERPRERRRRARIEAILDESMSILLNEGADALTMRRLADSLDLTAGAIYRYFPGKGSPWPAWDTGPRSTVECNGHSRTSGCHSMGERR